MRVSDWAAYMLNTPWQWGKHDCISFVEHCTGLERPQWACTETELEARLQARQIGDGSEWVCVYNYLNEMSGVERLNAMPARPGDIALTSRVGWTYNQGRNVVGDGNNTWAIGMIDESYRFVAYCDGVMMQVGEPGHMWRLSNEC